jgi:chromosome segregation ATPase
VADLDDLEARVTHLEHSVTDARRDAAAARVLAGAADRDVSEFRQELKAHTKTLNALRETQLEHGQRLDSLETKMDAMDRKMSDGFSTVAVGMAEITALIRHAEGK